MLRARILTAVVLGPLVIFAIARGGWLFDGLVLVALSIGAVEWVQLAVRAGQHVSGGFTLLYVWLFFADRLLPQANLASPGLALLLIASMGWAVIRYRQGADRSMVGFALTLAGGVYIGWLGAHFVALRNLPDGGWWTGVVIPAVWLADTFAYTVGMLWGRTRLMPDVSPKKSWEGYLAGIAGGGLGGAGLALLWRALGAGPDVTPLHGLVIGLMGGAIGPIGDLGISAFKRQVGAKDSGGLLPGHGGFLDRIDALVVAVPIGYHYIVNFALHSSAIASP